ncbi:MAG: VOC family protein [Flavobacterium sp.]|nr:MAG: VOC family protein [Flavobacterium sp.]
MNLNQITIPSKNVPRAIEFYVKLGLKLIVHTHDRYARFEMPEGDATFSIHEVDELPKANGVMVYFEVEDVYKTVTELKAKGFKFDTDVEEQSWLWTEVRLRDPDGNQLIIFSAGKNRKYPPWRKEGV